MKIGRVKKNVREKGRERGEREREKESVEIKRENEECMREIHV